MSQIYIIGVQVKLITVAKKFKGEVLASIYPQELVIFGNSSQVQHFFKRQKMIQRT